jgi:hypothetical protein
LDAANPIPHGQKSLNSVSAAIWELVGSAVAPQAVIKIPKTANEMAERFTPSPQLDC